LNPPDKQESCQSLLSGASETLGMIVYLCDPERVESRCFSKQAKAFR